MSETLVVDSSVVPKWYVPEAHREFAQRLRGPMWTLVAPRFMAVELTSIAVQKLRRGSVEDAEALSLARVATLLPVQFVDDHPHLAEAYRLARLYHPSVYDCLYAAVALSLGCRCVTADRPFYAALAAPYPETMLWVEDIPETA